MCQFMRKLATEQGNGQLAIEDHSLSQRFHAVTKRDWRPFSVLRRCCSLVLVLVEGETIRKEGRRQEGRKDGL